MKNFPSLLKCPPEYLRRQTAMQTQVQKTAPYGQTTAGCSGLTLNLFLSQKTEKGALEDHRDDLLGARRPECDTTWTEIYRSPCANWPKV